MLARTQESTRWWLAWKLGWISELSIVKNNFAGLNVGRMISGPVKMRRSPTVTLPAASSRPVLYDFGPSLSTASKISFTIAGCDESQAVGNVESPKHPNSRTRVNSLVTPQTFEPRLLSSELFP